MRRRLRVTAVTGSTTEVGVSRTSMMRSALTSARGTIMNIIVAIITDMRICMM